MYYRTENCRGDLAMGKFTGAIRLFSEPKIPEVSGVHAKPEN